MPSAPVPVADLRDVATHLSAISVVQFHQGPLDPRSANELLHGLAELERLTLAGEASLWGIAGLGETLSQPQSTIAVIGKPDALIAYCLFTCVIDECEILQIATHPQATRRGYGQALLRAVLDHAVARGCDHAVLEVRRGNQPARALYDRFGFQAVGLRRGYYPSGAPSPSDPAANDALLLSRPIPG